MTSNVAAASKYLGLNLPVTGLGEVQLQHILHGRTDTHVFYTNHPGVVVKLFDLDCGKADEISYGPYADFGMELANFEFTLGVEDLKSCVPAYYGAHIDYAAKYACIALEYLQGPSLKSWCDDAIQAGYREEWLPEFREAVFETLSLLQRFHQQGVILMDFKPENVIRLPDRSVRFVDLGALFTPKHLSAIDKYVYSATTDHAEVLIDASNLQTGVPPTPASDIFSAGVALFEMATGRSRLAIDGAAANEMLSHHSLSNFRDSQIRRVWQAFPHLRESLPLVAMQLQERNLLFADLWHLLKALAAEKTPDWDALPTAAQEQVIQTTGTDFIRNQLSPPVQWLAEPIALATTLRSLRLKSVTELMNLIAQPAPAEAQAYIADHNGFVQYARDLSLSTGFLSTLNTWQVRLNPETGGWAVSAALASAQMAENASLTCLRETGQDSEGHRFFEIVGDLDADQYQGDKLSVRHLRQDHFAWLE
jgi:serine/threonine protein kinase